MEVEQQPLDQVEALWHDFFHNPSVSQVHRGIRDELLTTAGSMIRARENTTYQDFKQWIRDYFKAFSYNSADDSIMNAMYFAKFQHARCHETESRLNMLIVMPGAAGIRNRLHTVATSCPSSTIEWKSDQALDSGDKILFHPEFKEASSGRGVVLAVSREEVTDPNLLSRFIVHVVPRYVDTAVGNRPMDRYHGEDELAEEQRTVHRVYFVVEQMMRNCTMQRVIQVLDDAGITGIRRRDRVVEMVRCICVSYAVWCGLSSVQTRHLQYDADTKKIIGLNPRVFHEGIFPLLIVSGEMITDALSYVPE